MWPTGQIRGDRIQHIVHGLKDEPVGLGLIYTRHIPIEYYPIFFYQRPHIVQHLRAVVFEFNLLNPAHA
jgi:hypothetical protein